jgi:hypothetical protein
MAGWDTRLERHLGIGGIAASGDQAAKSTVR